MKTIAMKRTNITTKTLLFLLLALAGTAKAQNTHLSVVKDSIEYNTLYAIQGYPIWYYTTQTLTMVGDTTLDGVSYKRLYEKFSSLFNLDFELIGHVREIPNKVYYRPIDQTDDYLLYDFDLGVGDTTFMYWQQYPAEWTKVYVRIDSIVSKFIGDTIRDCYYVSSRDEGYQNWAFLNTWIEGIGAKEGFLNSFQSQQIGGYSWPQLLCYKDHGEILYINDQYNTCVIDNYDSVEENENPNLFFDNSRSMLRYTGHWDSSSSVSIFNLMGQRVYYNGTLCNDYLDLNNLTPGLYIAVLRSEKSVSCLKFIKN
jgi:hypothetical protein